MKWVPICTQEKRVTLSIPSPPGVGLPDQSRVMMPTAGVITLQLTWKNKHKGSAISDTSNIIAIRNQHCSHCWESKEIADGLVPHSCQDICNNHDDIGYLIHLKSTLTLTDIIAAVHGGCWCHGTYGVSGHLQQPWWVWWQRPFNTYQEYPAGTRHSQT